tara:strand:- start:36 stop:332 length:297 start_codon:yes stop_codon:yes gene_type:complete
MSSIGAVIGWKFPNQEGMATKSGVITDFPGGIPSQSDQDAWTAEYEAHLAATAYQEKRVAAYASIGDQLDMQYWDAVNGTTTWKDHVAKVKSDNAKPD